MRANGKPREPGVLIKENVAEGDEAGQQEGGMGAAVTTRVEEPDEAAIESRGGKGLRLSGDRARTCLRRAANSTSRSPPAPLRSRGRSLSPLPAASTDWKRQVPRPNILVPVTGTATSRRGAEFAIALAQASRGSVTALHFVGQSQGPAAAWSWRHEVQAAIAPMGSADAVIREIVRLGDPYGVAVKPAVQSAGTSQDAILHQIKSGRHNLVVMGVSMRPGEQLDFGPTAAALLDQAECSLMFVVSEQPTTVAETVATSERDQSVGHMDNV